MRLHDIEGAYLYEDLIGKVVILGDQTHMSKHFSKVDQKWINRYASEENALSRAFSKVPYNCRIFICCTEKETPFNGEISRSDLSNYVSDPTELDIVFQNTQNTITIIYASNNGEEEAKTAAVAGISVVSFTPWTALHRLSHAMEKSKSWQKFALKFYTALNTILNQHYDIQPHKDLFVGVNGDVKVNNDGYNKSHWISQFHMDLSSAYHQLLSAIGTTASARNRKILSPSEYIHDMVAQYCWTGGKIKLNPLPESLKAVRMDNKFKNQTTIEYFYQGDEQNKQLVTKELEADAIQMVEELFKENLGKVFLR